MISEINALPRSCRPAPLGRPRRQLPTTLAGAGWPHGNIFPPADLDFEISSRGLGPDIAFFPEGLKPLADRPGLIAGLGRDRA